MRLRLYAQAVGVALYLWWSSVAFAAANLNVPLTVHEAVPAAVPGQDRTAEIATGGIPLAEDSGIFDVSQLGLKGAQAGQFRVLGRWSNGNIKWVLVDFPTTLRAGGTDSSVSLVTGSGNFGGADLAADTGSQIVVSTGAASFTLRKANFNIFDVVSVGTTQLVSPNNAGRLRLVGPDGVEYASSNDGASTCVIEENGPVRAVIRASGAFKSSTGARWIDYTMRLHFYKGKSHVKGVIELCNASKTNAYLSRAFKSVEAKVGMSLGAGKRFAFERYSANTLHTTAASILPGATAYLFQGYANNPQTASQFNFNKQSLYWSPPIPGVANAQYQYSYDPGYSGVKIGVGASVLHPFGNPDEWSGGTGLLLDGTGRGVAVAFRQLWQYWPGGFEFKDNGEVSIELYSKYNDNASPHNPASTLAPIKLAFGQHNTREVLWEFFAASPPAASKVSYQLEYPLLVRAPFQYYTSTRAIYGQGEFVTPAEQVSLLGSLSKSTGSPSTNLAASFPQDVPNVFVWRGWSWASGGGWNQNNHVGDDMLDYLRTDGGGFYLRGENRAKFHNDTAFTRSDDFTTENITANSEGLAATPTLASGNPDGEHTYLYGQPLYYYLSGNESAREGWLDYGDRLLRNNITGYYKLPYSQWLRGISNTMRNSVLVYEFSCEVGACMTGLKTALEGAVNYQLDSREKLTYGPGSQGRNLDRGYLYWDVDVTFGGAKKRLLHSLYHNHIHFESLYQVWRVMKTLDWRYPRLQEMDDYLTGLAKFYLEEWFEPPPATDLLAKAPFNFPYVQHYDLLLDERTPYNPYPGAGFSVPYSVSRAALWGYERTGISKYLKIGANMVWEQPAYSQDSMRNPSELQDQAMMFYYLNPSLLPTWQPLPINVTDNGDGSYKLSWTVPEGVAKYQFKYSNEQIVEWLGFDKETRAYQYDPAVYTPFFAATNIENNPAPTAVGVTQTLVLSGLPLNLNFSAKYLRGRPTLPPGQLRSRPKS